jgi:cyanate permease
MHRDRASKTAGPSASLLLSVFFGLQGILYFIVVAYAAYQLARDNPGRTSAVIPGLAIGLLVAVSFLRASILLRREKRNALKWIVLPLVIIAAQWLIDLSPPPGQLVTFFLSLIGVTVSWLELTRKDEYQSRVERSATGTSAD